MPPLFIMPHKKKSSSLYWASYIEDYYNLVPKDLVVNDAGIWLAGAGGAGSLGPMTGFLSQISLDGSTLIDDKRISGLGDSGIAGVAFDSSGNRYVCGYTYDYITSTSNKYAAFIAKYDSTGVLQWKKKINSSSVATKFMKIIVTANGPLVVGSHSNASYTLGFIVQFTAAGAILWQQKLGDNAADVAIDVVVDTSGGIYTLITSGSVGYIVKYLASGVVAWYKSIATLTATTGALAVIGTDVYVLVTGSATLSTSSQTVPILIKYNSAGTLQWQRGFGTVSTSVAAHGMDLVAYNSVLYVLTKLRTVTAGVVYYTTRLTRLDTTGALLGSQRIDDITYSAGSSTTVNAIPALLAVYSGVLYLGISRARRPVDYGNDNGRYGMYLVKMPITGLLSTNTVGLVGVTETLTLVTSAMTLSATTPGNNAAATTTAEDQTYATAYDMNAAVYGKVALCEIDQLQAYSNVSGSQIIGIRPSNGNVMVVGSRMSYAMDMLEVTSDFSGVLALPYAYAGGYQNPVGIFGDASYTYITTLWPGSTQQGSVRKIDATGAQVWCYTWYTTSYTSYEIGGSSVVRDTSGNITHVITAGTKPTSTYSQGHTVIMKADGTVLKSITESHASLSLRLWGALPAAGGKLVVFGALGGYPYLAVYGYATTAGLHSTLGQYVFNYAGAIYQGALSPTSGYLYFVGSESGGTSGTDGVLMRMDPTTMAVDIITVLASNIDSCALTNVVCANSKVYVAGNNTLAVLDESLNLLGVYGLPSVGDFSVTSSALFFFTGYGIMKINLDASGLPSGLPDKSSAFALTSLTWSASNPTITVSPDSTIGTGFTTSSTAAITAATMGAVTGSAATPTVRDLSNSRLLVSKTDLGA